MFCTVKSPAIFTAIAAGLRFTSAQVLYDAGTYISAVLSCYISAFDESSVLFHLMGDRGRMSAEPSGDLLERIAVTDPYLYGEAVGQIQLSRWFHITHVCSFPQTVISVTNIPLQKGLFAQVN